MIYVVIDRETITGLSSAKGFTATHIPPTEVDTIYAIVQALDDPVRFCVDGTTPEATLGIKIVKETIIEIWGGSALRNFLAIDDGGTAKLEVIYMGRGG